MSSFKKWLIFALAFSSLHDGGLWTSFLCRMAKRAYAS